MTLVVVEPISRTLIPLCRRAEVEHMKNNKELNLTNWISQRRDMRKFQTHPTVFAVWKQNQQDNFSRSHYPPGKEENLVGPKIRVHGQG
jgi:hypothetical protein